MTRGTRGFLRRRRRRAEDRGAGTVVVLGLAALGGAVALAVAAWSMSLAAQRTADAAADLAALAAASAGTIPGGAPDCARASAVAAAQGARMRSCLVAADGTVVVEVALALRTDGWAAGAVPAEAVGRARAGPAPAAPPEPVEPAGLGGSSSGGLGQHRVEEQARAPLVERRVAVAALGGLHARRAARLARAVLEHGAGRS